MKHSKKNTLVFYRIVESTQNANLILYIKKDKNNYL